MTAINKRELHSYFTGIIGYVMIAFLIAIFGIYTTSICLGNKYANFEFVPYAMKYVFLVTTPILSMRVLSEERKQNTDKLLYSNALESWRIIAGKYLSMITVLAVPFVVAGVYPLILSKFGKVTLLTSYSTLLGLFLMGAALLAIGMFTSSLTDSQIVAAAICFGVIFVAYIAKDLTSLISGTPRAALYGLTVIVIAIGLIAKVISKNWIFAGIVAAVLEVIVIMMYFANSAVVAGIFGGILDAVAVFDKVDTFKNGVFDLSAVFYYLSVIAVFSFFSIQSLEKRRWS